ncbi:MAG: hypothetical protein K5790_01545 [Nitrosopumilus sp.]|uniref:hypothetical protein n=1 Tax=Nitrosopumilus sp. TaxID=2024843 RepID=UPI00247E8CCF|nr:hypothetical protein [Nitrosopumilus sp.]MCV0391958.1 hypothetical protein [Nitrosopumilus sp.]
MNTRYKIIIIAVIIVASIPGIIIFGAVPLMIVTNAYSGFIMFSTSDKAFEEDFAKIPEVKIFIEKYPNYTTHHSADFLGWKVIYYEAIENEKILHLYVKKSVLHHGVKISAGCSNLGSYSYGYDILDEQVMDYIKNDRCVGK